MEMKADKSAEIAPLIEKFERSVPYTHGQLASEAYDVGRISGLEEAERVCKRIIFTCLEEQRPVLQSVLESIAIAATGASEAEQAPKLVGCASHRGGPVAGCSECNHASFGEAESGALLAQEVNIKNGEQK